MTDALDVLFSTRFHGATNIRGIQYQILYSLYRSFELYQENANLDWMHLEGIEDVDLVGIHFESEYVQVKTSNKPWSWSQLREPLAGFLGTHRANPNAKLTLAVNFTLRHEIASLADFENLPPPDQNRIAQKFRNLMGEIGAFPVEADSLRSRLSIVSVSDEALRNHLRTATANAYDLGTSAVDTYILALTARFLGWASERRHVAKSDLESVRIEIGESLSREAEFQAYGRGLIGRISWAPDQSPDDFFEGKGTRPGHIVDGLDVDRPNWIQLIDKAVKSAKVCVLRTASGQGKSSLLYRYAHDYWPANGVLVLNAAESMEHVQTIRSYLELLAQLGQPNLVLIDNAGIRTRFWSDVAADCVRLGFRVLVSVREEDWFRFARETFTSYEVLNPHLNLEEAREIFAQLRSAGRVHKDIASAERAYDRIGEPHLLLEFVYLLTYGRMLEERLREQERQFVEQGEDPVKTEVLRRVALAHVLGARLDADRLMSQVQTRDDAGSILKSLTGEYIRVTEDGIDGFHWVRSDHLVRILHETFPSETRTGIATLPAIQSADLAAYVANALMRPEINSPVFLQGISEQVGNLDLGAYLAIVEGVFEAGERQFFRANQPLFDEVYRVGGSNLVFLVSSGAMPCGQTTALNYVIDFLGDRGERLRNFRDLLLANSGESRGLHAARVFLNSTLSSLGNEKVFVRPGAIGRLLDWCALTESRFPNWVDLRGDFVTRDVELLGDVEDVVSFAQGLFRYDEDSYREWLARQSSVLIDSLRLMLDCLDIVVSDEAVEVTFLYDERSSLAPNDQAVTRLQALRSAFPFADKYRSRGIWLLPGRLSPSVDDTRKDMPRENLRFQSDVSKNVIWRKSVDMPYAIDCFYDYQRDWHDFRQQCLVAVRMISQTLKRLRTPEEAFSVIANRGRVQAFVDIERAKKHLPRPPIQTPVTLAEALKRHPSGWSSAIHSFLVQAVRCSATPSDPVGPELTLSYFREAQKQLLAMHEVFAGLFDSSPDYFSLAALAQDERKTYETLELLLEAWLIDRPQVPQYDMLKYARLRRENRERQLIEVVASALVPIQTDATDFTLPSHIIREHPLTYFPIGFAISNVCNPLEDLERIIRALVRAKNVADFYWLVPTRHGVLLDGRGYLLSSENVQTLASGQLVQWESLVPQDIRPQVREALFNLPLLSPVAVEIRSKIHAVLLGLEMCVEGEDLIGEYSRTGSKPETELMSRTENRFRKLRTELLTSAKHLETQIRAESDRKQGAQDRLVVLEFLQDVQSLLQNRPVGEMHLPQTNTWDEAIAAADRLYCG